MSSKDYLVQITRSPCIETQSTHDVGSSTRRIRGAVSTMSFVRSTSVTTRTLFKYSTTADLGEGDKGLRPPRVISQREASWLWGMRFKVTKAFGRQVHLVCKFPSADPVRSPEVLERWTRT